jgi:serine/threonine-protein kinase
VPFPADSIIALAYRIANEGPSPLRERRPEIPAGLERAVLRCLERDPDRRYPDARSLASALEPYRARFVPRLARPHREPGEDDEMTVVDSRVTEPALPAGLAEESLGTSSVSWAPKRGADGVAIWRRSAAFLVGAAVAAGFVAAFGVARTVPTAAPAAAKLVSVPPALSAAPMVELVTLPAPAVPTIEPPTVSISDLPSVPLRPAPVATAPVAPPAAAKVDPDGILLANPPPASSKARPTPSPAPSDSNCTPPYDFDELGEKIAKPECRGAN